MSMNHEKNVTPPKKILVYFMAVFETAMNFNKSQIQQS